MRHCGALLAFMLNIIDSSICVNYGDLFFKKMGLLLTVLNWSESVCFLRALYHRCTFKRFSHLSTLSHIDAVDNDCMQPHLPFLIECI